MDFNPLQRFPIPSRPCLLRKFEQKIEGSRLLLLKVGQGRIDQQQTMIPSQIADLADRVFTDP